MELNSLYRNPNKKVFLLLYLIGVIFSIFELVLTFIEGGKGGPCNAGIILVFLLPFMFLSVYFLFFGLGSLRKKSYTKALAFFIVVLVVTLVFAMTVSNDIGIALTICYFAPIFIYLILLIMMAYMSNNNHLTENTK